MKKLKQGNIIIDDVSVIFERDGVKNTAIDSTSIKIMPGEFVCILGPSGCGKSTLLNAVAGFISPTQGSVSVDGNIVEKPGPDRGMVFQQYSLFPWKTIRENVAFGPLRTGSGRAAAETNIKIDCLAIRLVLHETDYIREHGMPAQCV